MYESDAFVSTGAWPRGTIRALGSSLSLVLIEPSAHVRGPVPGLSIRANGRRLNAAPVQTISTRARRGPCPLRHAKGMTLSPAGSGDAAQWAASITDRRGSGDQALNGAHWAPAPPPKGEARLGFLQASGGLPTWLPLRGRYVPVGRRPAADRGGSRDAGTAAAVTERANPKLPQGRRKEEGQVRGKTQVLCGVALIRPQGQVSGEKGRRHLLTRPLGQVSRSRIFPSFFLYLTLGC